MSFELVLFIVVAAVAIFSASLMLVSRNAVHCALFLVTNLLCVAFFYLMLSAPFLAMVQVTVYAGAIMVLFMFVIMLLGAEKLGGATTKFTWIVPAAVGLTTIFLVVAFVAIVNGQVGLLKPVPPQPEVRFVHAVAGVAKVDVYLTNEKVASDLAFREPTNFTEVRASNYNFLVFPSCTLENKAECPDPLKTNATPLLTQPVTLNADTATTFILAGTSEQVSLLSVPTDLSVLDDDNRWRLTAVNALPGTGNISLIRVDPVTPQNSEFLSPALGFGQVSETKILERGTYNFEWRQGEARLVGLRDFVARGKTHEMLILLPEASATADDLGAMRADLLRINPPARTADAFGSPQQIGSTLLTDFILPFELVALLLLSAMVGAIILTREEVARRERKRLVVSQAIRRINRGLTMPVAPQIPAQQPQQPVQQPGETSAD